MIDILNSHLDDFIPHWHNRLQHVQYHVLVLVSEGRLIYHLNDRELHASKGDLLFIPSGTYREAKNDSHTLHQKYTVIFTSTDDLGLPLLQSAEPRLLHTRAFDYFKEKFMLLHRQTLENRPYFRTIRIGILLEMLSTVCREIESPPMPARKLHYAGMLEQHMIRHFREAISLQELAGLIDRSPNYTLSVFKEVTGQTPLEYQHRLRITSAMEMLQNTNLSITCIAEHLGYYDTSYFYKMFRRHTGFSPTSYMNLKSDPSFRSNP